MMINKRLIGTVSESKKYIAGSVAFQWCAMAANICMIAAAARLLEGLYLGTAGGRELRLTAFPFLLLAAFCFGKSSSRLHAWFTGTKLYKENLESYVRGRGMTRGAKIRIMVTVTLLMSVGFVMMHQVPAGRAVLGCVWVFRAVYFLFGVRTIPSGTEG